MFELSNIIIGIIIGKLITELIELLLLIVLIISKIIDLPSFSNYSINEKYSVIREFKLMRPSIIILIIKILNMIINLSFKNYNRIFEIKQEIYQNISLRYELAKEKDLNYELRIKNNELKAKLEQENISLMSDLDKERKTNEGLETALDNLKANKLEKQLNNESKTKFSSFTNPRLNLAIQKRLNELGDKNKYNELEDKLKKEKELNNELKAKLSKEYLYCGKLTYELKIKENTIISLVSAKDRLCEIAKNLNLKLHILRCNLTTEKKINDELICELTREKRINNVYKLDKLHELWIKKQN
jgi:hypothetical protein